MIRTFSQKSKRRNLLRQCDLLANCIEISPKKALN
jgi:hypothetical protein